MDLADRLRRLREIKNLSQQELAKETDLKVEQVQQIEETSDASIQELVQISKFFNADLNWFILGTQAKTFAMDYMVLIDSKVAAGYLKKKDEPTFYSQLEYYRIPGFPAGGNHRLFLVHGDSMYPTISEDDHLVCSQVDDANGLEDGDLTVLVTDSDIVVKRIRRDKEVLVLESDNPKFKSYTLDLSEVREIWRVEAKVTKSLEQFINRQNDIDTVAEDVKGMRAQIHTFKAELEDLKKKYGQR